MPEGGGAWLKKVDMDALKDSSEREVAELDANGLSHTKGRNCTMERG